MRSLSLFHVAHLRLMKCIFFFFHYINVYDHINLPVIKDDV